MKDGIRCGSDRVDVIFEGLRTLFLIELKCCTSELEDDFIKLRRIRDTLGLKGIMEAIRRQGISVSDADTLVLGCGVEAIDAKFAEEFVCFELRNEGIRIVQGARLALDSSKVVQNLAGYLVKNTK